jgi:hypothetical protein
MILTQWVVGGRWNNNIEYQVWPPGGALTCTWYSQPGTLYLFVHISYETTHQHFAFFTCILISYEIHAGNS